MTDISSMPTFSDCMLDIETLGSKPGASILAIGAIGFDPVAKKVADRSTGFEMAVDLQSCLDHGLKVEGKTFEWWMEPAKQAAWAAIRQLRKELLPVALAQFASWYRAQKYQRGWSHGLDFDIPLLNVAYKVCRLEEPWAWRMVRDTRTVFDLAGIDLKSIPVEGTAHTPLDDAIHQAKAVGLGYEKLGHGSSWLAQSFAKASGRT